MAKPLIDGNCPRCKAKIACPVDQIVMFRGHDPQQEIGSWNLTLQCKFCNEPVIIGRLFPVIDTNPVQNQVDTDENVDSQADGGYTDE